MYVSGGGVGLRLEDAIRSAIAEVVQAERMARSAQLTPDWELTMGVEKRFGIKPDAELSDFTNFIQVVDYYGYPENQRKLDWFFRNPNSPRIKLSENQPPRSAVPELSDILGLYDKYDLTPIAFDLTPSDFRRVSTTKVFVPELAPAFPPNNPQLGHRRYREIPQKLDLVNRPWTYADMPTDPLPIPDEYEYDFSHPRRREPNTSKESRYCSRPRRIRPQTAFGGADNCVPHRSR